MRIDDGYRVFEYGLLLAANEVEEGGLCWVAVGILRVIDAAVAPIEGMWAKGRVKLASEPKGKRFGLFDAKGRGVDIEAPIGTDWKGANGVKPIRAVMVGDSLVAGCGVDDQSKGIMPLLAARVAKRTGRPVAWRTVGKLGATARRVRYRMIGDINDRPDVLIVCVGGNDMLAGRSVREWAADITPVLDAAKNKAGKMVHSFAGHSIHHCRETIGDDQPVLIERLVRPLALAVLFYDVHSDFRFHGCQNA